MAQTLAHRLQLKPGQRLRLLNPPQGYADWRTAQLPDTTVATGGSGSADPVLVFVSSLAEAERLALKAIGAVKVDGLLWMTYPQGASKIKTDVNRDRLWEAIKPMGWLAIRQIASDDIWSAMRLRPAELVGK